MKIPPYVAAILATLFVSAVLAARPAALLAAPKESPCAVCVVKEGSGPEPVRATATYEGKEYTFCQEECKQEFLKNPQAFLKANTPRSAPAFTLKDLNGKSVSLSDYRGKVVLLDFWATFCSPCLKAMPKLQKLNDQHAAKGFAVIGIATDEDGAKVVAPVVKKRKVTYPILLANEAAWTEYDVTALPTLFLIDRSGQIVKRFGGGTEHKTIEREVERLLTQ